VLVCITQRSTRTFSDRNIAPYNAVAPELDKVADRNIAPYVTLLHTTLWCLSLIDALLASMKGS